MDEGGWKEVSRRKSNKKGKQESVPMKIDEIDTQNKGFQSQA